MDIHDEQDNYDKPTLRHVFLWGAFAVLLAVGVWTVLLPALEDSDVDPNAPESHEVEEVGPGADEAE